MPQPNLTVKLDGSPTEAGAVSFAEFRGFCGGLAACLHKVEAVVAVETRIRYLISELRTGSCIFALEPDRQRKGQDRSGDVLNLFVDTVVRLEDGQPVDPRFSRDDLRLFRRLADQLNRGLAGVEIAGKQITTRFIANID